MPHSNNINNKRQYDMIFLHENLQNVKREPNELYKEQNILSSHTIILL